MERERGWGREGIPYLKTAIADVSWHYHSTTALLTHISSWGWKIGPLVAAVQRHVSPHQQEQREQNIISLSVFSYSLWMSRPCSLYRHLVGSRCISTISAYSVFKLQFAPTIGYNYVTVAWGISISNSVRSAIYCSSLSCLIAIAEVAVTRSIPLHHLTLHGRHWTRYII
jgi:hypothetical protein